MSRWFSLLVSLLVLAGQSFAAEHRIPPPRPQAHVEEILAQGDEFSTDRKLHVVLLAGPKDHGPFEHDYPLWHKRWKVLVGGLEEGDERVLNIFGAPLSVTDEELAGAENVELSTAWVWPTDEQWEKADLVVMYSAPPPWTPERLAQLEAFLARGGGFVSIHMSMWQDSKELADLIGIGKHAATWFRHGPVRLELADHDITRGLPETVDLVDESYFNFQGDPSRVNILATGKETRPGETQVRDEPLYWTFEHGKGRVFVCIPGHYMWSFDDPYFRIILLRGMAWAAGESPFRFDPLVLRGARVYRPTESEAPRASDQNLVLWLDATDRGSQVVEQGQVAAWKNRAAGRKDALTSEGPQRPRLVPEGIGGQPSLRFDGKDDVLRNLEFRESAAKWTVFLVAAPKSNEGDGVPNGFHGFFSANAPGGLDWTTGLTIDMGGYATDRFNALNIESNKGTGAGNLLYAGSDFGQPRVLAAVSDGLETTLYAEGEPQLSRKANDTPTSFAQIRVGARFYHQGRETGFLDGDIAEVLIYNTALSPERIRSLSHHLQSKYGVAVVVEAEVSGSLDDAIAALPKLDWTLARAPLAPIDRALRSSDPSELADLEQRLVKVLEQGANPAATDFIARRLAMIGTARSVPALSKLLGDRERAASACYALTEIEASEAGAALVAALPESEGALRLQVIEGLGMRREQEAVEPLLDLFNNGDADVAAAIAAALGEIGDARAVEPLTSRHGVPASALLTLASRLTEKKDSEGAERVYHHLEQGAPAHLQAAILAGRVAADVAAASDRLIQALASDDPVLFGQGAALVAHQVPESVVAEVLADFDNWRPEVQRALLGQRWNRLPEKGRQLALAAGESEVSEVRADGLMLLSRVGKSEDIVTLAELAAEGGDAADAARHALRHLNAKDIDKAILDAIANTAEAAQVELIRAASDRRIKEASDALLAYLEAPQDSVRLATIEALQVVGEASAVGALLPQLLTTDSPPHQAALERAIWLCAQRAASDEATIAPLLAAYDKASPADRGKLLPVMGRLGGERALEVIDAARSDGALRSAALRGLANWPDATVADRLLAAARDEETESDRIAALRGYIRVVTLPGVREDEETLTLLKEALPLVKRPEEVRLVISRLPAIRTAGALELASSYVDDPSVADAEVAALTRLAEAMITDAPDQARDLMRQLLPKTTDAALRARLERAIARP